MGNRSAAGSPGGGRTALKAEPGNRLFADTERSWAAVANNAGRQRRKTSDGNGNLRRPGLNRTGQQSGNAGEKRISEQQKSLLRPENVV